MIQGKVLLGAETKIEAVLADYTSVNGDSGAPIFIYSGYYNNKHTCTIIGIHTATARVESPATKVFAKYSNIASLLNITAITE